MATVVGTVAEAVGNFQRHHVSAKRRNIQSVPHASFGSIRTADSAALSSKRSICLNQFSLRNKSLPATRTVSRQVVLAQEASSKKKLAVFVSGGGSNMKAIHKAILDGKINAEIVVIVSDKASCGGVDYAHENKIPTLRYPVKKGEAGLSAEDMVHQVKDVHKADYVVLAGYLKMIPQGLVDAYHRAILNIHPALLPAFGGKGMYGSNVHKAVIAHGARVSGPTVHFVDFEYDTGPIIAQRVVPVYADDTYDVVAARVLKEEHKVFPDVLAALCDDRVHWRDDGIPYIHSADGKKL